METRPPQEPDDPTPFDEQEVLWFITTMFDSTTEEWDIEDL